MDTSSLVQSSLGGFTKQFPLISFHSIIDEDMALIKYILLEFRNEQVFDLDKVKDMTYFDILGDLYKRKYSNPLYFLSKNDKFNDFLDQCYKEFTEEHESEVLRYAVTTEMYNLTLDFLKSGEIAPTILCYTQSQLDLVNSIDELKDVEKILLNNIKESDNKRYTQYYFKYLTELEPFKGLEDKTFYFSTCGQNLVDDNNDILIELDLLKDIASNRNGVNIFDLYRIDLIGNYNNGDKINNE